MNLKLPDLDSPGSGLGEVLSELAERLVGRIRSLPGEREKNVHDLRVCAKKLRSLLRLARPLLGKEKHSHLSAEIRDLKNAFAGSRDTYVMRAAIVTLTKGCGGEHLAESLVPRKKEKPLDLPRLLCRAESLGKRIANLDFSSLSRKDLLGQAKKTYRKARRLCLKCHDTSRGELMHEWRKRVKDLQYQTQALDISHHRVGRLSDALGEYNDLEILSRFLRNRRVPREFRKSLNKAKETLREAVFDVAEKVFKKKPAKWLDAAG